MNFEIRLDKTYPQSIDKVWRAISEAEMISAWFIQAEFKAEVGYQYTFTHESTKIVGEVQQVDPPNLLIYTWIVGDPNVTTEVKWVLTETDDGTNLAIIHTGISGYGESAANFFENFNNGWASCLDNLAEYLQK